MTKLHSIKLVLGSISFFLYLYAIFLLVQSPNLETKFNNDKVDSDSWFNYIFQLEKLSFAGYKNLIVGISLHVYIALVFYMRFFNWCMARFNEMAIQDMNKAEIAKGFVKFIPACVFPILYILICYNVKDLNGAWVVGLVYLSLTILKLVLDNEEDAGLVWLFRIYASISIPMQNKNMSEALVLSGFFGASVVVEEVMKWALNSLKPPKAVNASRKPPKSVDTSQKEVTTPL